jgi:hypothetical protein
MISLNVNEEQQIWEWIFVAALRGAATSTNGWAEDRTEFLLNRAERLADDATKRVLSRREVAKRKRLPP